MPVEEARRLRYQNISHGRLAWKRVRLQSEGQLGSKNLTVFLKGSSSVELAAPTPPIESAPRENASVKTPIGGRSVARATTREPERAWITQEVIGDCRPGEREHLHFLPDFI